jgi:hypothetical protein
VLVPGETVERALPWLDSSSLALLSRDGKHIAFSDFSQSAGSDYAVAWRDTQGGPVVRLGKGYPLSVSPDARWIAAEIPSTGKIVFYPTGTGDAIALSSPLLMSIGLQAQWFSDSAHLLLCGTIGNAASRCYRVEARADATPEPVTPEGVIGAALGSDDRTLLLQMKDRTLRRSAIGGDAGTPVGSIRPDDLVLALSRDLKAVYVRTKSVPVRVERVELATGARSLVKTIGPPDSIGVTSVQVRDWPENGGYAYDFGRTLSQLFVVSGIKK